MKRILIFAALLAVSCARQHEKTEVAGGVVGGVEGGVVGGIPGGIMSTGMAAAAPMRVAAVEIPGE